eukprot:tig00021234_g19403.t1
MAESPAAGLSTSGCSTPEALEADVPGGPSFNPISLLLVEAAARQLSIDAQVAELQSAGSARPAREIAPPPTPPKRPEPPAPANDAAVDTEPPPPTPPPNEAEVPRTGKQVFVLSNAGKPVFCRYGDESRAADQFGVMQALISIVRDTGGGDAIRYIRTATHLVSFLLRDPIYYVAVSPAAADPAEGGSGGVPPEPEGAVRRQLEAVHAQIASIVTSKAFALVERQPGYDLRNLIEGAQRQLRSLLAAMEGPHGAGFMLGAVRSVRLPPSTRAEAQRVLSGALRGSNLLFGALVAGWRLVALSRPRKIPLHPLDLLLLLNLLTSTGVFRRSENFTPICLPHFNDRGFVHAYVQFVASELALVLVTADGGSFFDLQAAKDALQRHLSETGTLYALNEAAKGGEMSAQEAHVPELRHFLYRVTPPPGSGGPPQYIAPAAEGPYASGSPAAARLARLYEARTPREQRPPPYPLTPRTPQVAHARLHDAEGSIPGGPVPASASFGAGAAGAGMGAAAGSKRKLVYLEGPFESILAWRHSEFELYGAVEAGAGRTGAVAACNRLLRWLKREEASMLVPFA